MRRHTEGKRHSDLARAAAPITSAFQASPAANSLDRQVTAAEVYFAAFIAEHNLPFLAADHFNKLCKVMFPDSDIAKRFS